MTPCNALCHMSLWRRTCLFCARGAAALGACALALRLCLGLRLLPHAMITDIICDTWVTWGAPGLALVQVHRVKLACIWSCLSIRVVLELFCPHHAGVCVCMHTLREPICNGVEIDNLSSLQLAVVSLSGARLCLSCVMAMFARWAHFVGSCSVAQYLRGIWCFALAARRLRYVLVWTCHVTCYVTLLTSGAEGTCFAASSEADSIAHAVPVIRASDWPPCCYVIFRARFPPT